MVFISMKTAHPKHHQKVLIKVNRFGNGPLKYAIACYCNDEYGVRFEDVHCDVDYSEMDVSCWMAMTQLDTIPVIGE